MKISSIYSVVLWVILTTLLNCKIFLRRDKRSVFDLIDNIDKGDMNASSPNKHSIFLSKAITDNKPITYQELKKIFLDNKTEEKQLTRNKIRKEEVKKQFLVKSQRKNKARFEKRQHEDIIVNFSFLTKMS